MNIFSCLSSCGASSRVVMCPHLPQCGSRIFPCQAPETGVIGNPMTHAQEVVKMESLYQALRKGGEFVLAYQQNLLLVLHVKESLNRSGIVIHQ
ncbi:hypothetical protein EB796_008345 [Bugula neritina]|uniref:Uncharacterized protein n=1 Tax=Bugula neritina TaxID=10212 RepID=A0A7J7K579_BUGNE|nr:hypothetical protein EB796_008345 [Bugula neritina]